MKRVLFVCNHNAGRSQMAEAFFNRYAGGQATAISAGIDPRPLDPVTVAIMAEIGFDISRASPKLLTPELVHTVDQTVAMAEGVGDELGRLSGRPVEEWPIPRYKGAALSEVRAIRDDIRRRVIGLIQGMGMVPEV
jgi:protein-tyrosine-phosphatase